MRYVFLAAFILCSCVHLYGSYKNDTKIRSATKPLIVITLLAYYLSSAPQVNELMVAFLVFSLLGDVALMINGFFAIGGVCFGLGHLCLILTYVPRIIPSKVSAVLIIAIACIYAVALVFLFKYLKGHIPKKLFVPMIVYMATNASMNLCAFMQLMSFTCAPSVLIATGAFLFFISDAMVYTVRFHKTQSVFTKHFMVMLTYISAVFLITYGSLIF